MPTEPDNIDLLSAYSTLIRAYVRTHPPVQPGNAVPPLTEEAKHD